ATMDGRVSALISHFDDLNRAHAAVLKARTQIDRLEPLVADCDRHVVLVREVESLCGARDALRSWFARAKRALLEKRIEKLGAEIARLDDRILGLEESRVRQNGERDEVKQAISANGGDRIERLKVEIARLGRERDERRARAGK